MTFSEVMSIIVYPVFMLLGGLAVFMYGMKIMSDSLEELGGSKMRTLLGKVSNNRFAGVGIGAGVTAIIQSSSATTVMLVGFVNVGLITLLQATPIIMGANIGTTITAQIASLGSFSEILNITAILALSACVGVFMCTFSKKTKIQKTGIIIAGLGMLFIGMYLMSDSMTGLKESGTIDNILGGVTNPFLLLFIGAVFTAIIQSSSAATGIIITLLGTGLMDPAAALFIVLGTNIGTCVTAILASIGTNTNAKRTAIIHLLFNVIGCFIVMIPFTIIYYLNNGVDTINNIMRVIGFGSTHYERQIANFHTIFNILVTLMLLPFTKVLVSLAKKIVPDKKVKTVPGEVATERHLEYLDDLILKTPPIAVAQIKKEVTGMCNIARENLKVSIDAVINKDMDKTEIVRLNEKKINFLNREITRYLVKISTLNISPNDEKFLGSLFHVVSDIERIGDYAVNFADYVNRMEEENVVFSQDALDDINNMYTKVDLLFRDSVYAFENRDVAMLEEVTRREQSIDEMKNKMTDAHIYRLNKGECNAESGAIYYSVASSLERVADHLTNVAFSIRSLTGSQSHQDKTIIKA